MSQYGIILQRLESLQRELESLKQSHAQGITDLKQTHALVLDDHEQRIRRNEMLVVVGFFTTIIVGMGIAIFIYAIVRGV